MKNALQFCYTLNNSFLTNMKKINFFLAIAISIFFVCGSAASAAAPELYISGTGKIHIIGSDLTKKYALNLLGIRIWGQDWTVTTDYATRFESLGGGEIKPEEVLTGHSLEILGKPVPDKIGLIDASLVRDLSIVATSSSATPVVSIGDGICSAYVTQSVKPLQEKIASLEAAQAAAQALMSKATTVVAPVSPTQSSVAAPPASAPSAPVASMLTENLYLGMRSEQVLVLQKFLQQHDWIAKTTPIAGYFGKTTENAVLNFQKSSGLASVGVVGEKTRALINTLLGR